MSQELLDAYLDGTLAQEREAEFIAWLRADPANIRAFVWSTHLDRALINQQLITVANQAANQAASQAASQALNKQHEQRSGSDRITKRPSRGLKTVRRQAHSRNHLFAMGGALLAALLLILLWVNRQTPGQPVANGKESVPEIVIQDDPLLKPENKSTITLKQPRISAVSGEVTIVGVLGQRQANVAEALVPGDKIKTGTSATAGVRYADGSQFELAAETVFILGTQPQHLLLERGRITADVAHLVSGSQVTIATPHALLTIIGTIFTVEAETQKTTLAVKQGHVRLDSFDGKSAQEITAGMSGIVSAEAQINTDLVVTSFDVVDMKTLRKIAPLHDGDVIDLSVWPRGTMPNIMVNTGSRVPGSVRCALFGKSATNIDKYQRKNVNVENSPPFELVFGDNGNANNSGIWKPSGSYVLVATPFAGPKATGAAGRSVVIHFTMSGKIPE